MATSPTARTLQLCKEMGWPAGVVERWIERAKKRIDLFGCIDVVALPERKIERYWQGPLWIRDILGIQCCTGSGHAAHVTKAKAEPRLRRWLAANGSYEVWSWYKYVKPIERKYWRVRREAITLADLGDKL